MTPDQSPGTPHKPTNPLNPILEAYQNLSRVQETLTTHDQLTGLMNKTAWQNDIEERIETGKAFGSIFIDLDEFKRVNDTLGHEAGDELLKSWADHLREHYHRKSDALAHTTVAEQESSESGHTLVSRWAGDESAITMDLSSNDQRGVDPETGERKSVEARGNDELAYFQAAIDSFMASLPGNIRALGFGVSYGFAVWRPEDHKTSDQFFAELDGLMYQTKAARKQQAREALPVHKRLAGRIGETLIRYSGITPPR